MKTGNRIPDLAVIIPAYNEASGLGGCLGSVRQALECAGATEAEVIVVDDHSTDETSDVARAHGALAIRQSRRLGTLAVVPRPCCSSSTPIVVSIREPSPLFCAALRDPPLGLSRHAANPTVGEPSNRSSSAPQFSAL